MAALLRHGLRRIGGSVLQRTQAALSSPAVAEERRRLLPRRMLHTHKVIFTKKKLSRAHDFLLRLFSRVNILN
jgi:hypothetical protein